MESLTSAASQRQVQATKYALYHEQTPEDTPGAPIPPKPPHHAGTNTAATGLKCSHQPHRLGHKSQTKSSPHGTTNALPPMPNTQMRKLVVQTSPFQKEKKTSDLHRGAATTLDAKATIDQRRQQWEKMRTFHSSNKLWPATQQPSTGTEGESPLVRMMAAPSTATRLSTYAWIKTLDNPMQGIERPIVQATTTKPLLSWDTWDKQPAWSMQHARSDKQHGQTSQPQRAVCSNRAAPASPNHPEPTADKKQWEHMRIFYSSLRLWPVMERRNSIGIEGDSPLIWTSLHPPADDKRLTTYAWEGHLENFMPWTQGQTERVTPRTPLISYARWNIRRGSDQLRMQGGADKPYSHRPPHGYHEPMAHPTQRPALDLQQHKRPTISVPLTKGQIFDQQCTTPSLRLVQSMGSKISGNLLARQTTVSVDDNPQPNPGANTGGNYSHRGTLLAHKDTQAIRGTSLLPNPNKSASAAMSKPNFHSPAEFPAQHPVVTTSALTVMAAILRYILLARLRSPRSTTSPLVPASYRYWNHHRSSCQAQWAKSRTSYWRWLTAIIEQRWDTAWDLITHRNVEIMDS